MVRKRGVVPHSDPLWPIGRIRVRSWAGLLFAIGIMVLFLVGVPAIRWFLLLAIPPGLLIGGLLFWLNRRRG